jgi:hypothetical protein
MKPERSSATLNLILWIAIAIAVFQIFQRIGFEWSGVHNSDSPIYSTVGRGILNGLIPYRDLFETKPPGIFLLHAVSLYFTDSDIVLRLLQIIILLATPFVVSYSTNANRAVAFLFGSILGLYLAYESGEMQVESYGVFFCLLFILGSKVPRKRVRLALQTLCLIGAIGMKEPFILSILASVLVLEPRKVSQSFLVPLAIAVPVGTLAMHILGYLTPYVQIYLSFMTGFWTHRIGSPLVRGFNVLKTAVNLWDFSPFLLILVVLLIVGCFWHLRKDKLAAAGLVAAIYLASFAVGTGGDYVSHHFIFALPLYAALFVQVSRSFDARYTVAIAALCVVFHAQTSYAERIQQVKDEDTEARQMAVIVDALLDNCLIDRYRIVGDAPNPFYGYTKHSPLGRAFMQYSLYMYETGFKDSFVQSVMAADVIITAKTSRPIPDALSKYIGQAFTSEQPRCAKDILKDASQINVLFRK